MEAINLGEDTDTIAAIAGGLAGIMYGIDDIPKHWVDNLARKGYILSLCDDFQIWFQASKTRLKIETPFKREI